jgi:catechol 2,3-dioxygenase-like lactoylglutathione lyase family enzyme
MIGRLHHVILDCPDPNRLADFYAALLGLSVTYRSPDFAVVARDDTSSGIGFQLSAGYQPPDWPSADRGQQSHLDVMVDDPDLAQPWALGLGARLLSAPGRVYADPAGHPFCLIARPSWAPVIG